MKKIVYIGSDGQNASLFQAAVQRLPGTAGQVMGPGATLPVPAALVVLDLPPSEGPADFRDLAKISDRAVSVPPLGAHARETERVLKAAKKSGVRLMPLATPFYHPGLATLFEIVGSGVLGTIRELTLSRTGIWPFCPLPRDVKIGHEENYWDGCLTARLFPAGEAAIQVVSGTEFGFSLTIDAENGTAMHTQTQTAGRPCHWRVVSQVNGAGSRTREGECPAEVPLAVELARCLAAGQPLSNRDIRQVVRRETAVFICGS